MDKSRLKQKFIHEFQEYLKILLFLAPLFCAFSTYRLLVLGRFKEGSFEYGTALFNALVLSKIILIGEYLKLGKRQEDRPLIYSTIFKALVFTLLVSAFRLLEEAVRGWLRGESIGSTFEALRSKDINEVVGRALVVFFALLPFFALRETGRVLGERKLADLFFRPRAST
jgi:hypothetical protein